MSLPPSLTRQLPPPTPILHGTGLYPLPLSLPRSGRPNLPHPQPRIRTPAPSASPLRPPFMSWTPAFLPRAVWRTLAFAALAIGAVLLVVASYRSGGGEGDWDASTYLDREDVLARGKASAKLGMPRPFGSLNAIPGTSRRPAVLADDVGVGVDVDDDGPNVDGAHAPPQPGPAARLPSDDQPFHPHSGHSRTLKPGKKDEYDLAPLPTLEEALAHLEPQLRAVKRKHGSIPSEHMLWEPLFQPYLLQNLKERYRHVREHYNTGTEQWQPIARRWYLVTVCRQVTGMLADWFATWTVLADYLGPESLVFSLLEGGSDDGA